MLRNGYTPDGKQNWTCGVRNRRVAVDRWAGLTQHQRNAEMYRTTRNVLRRRVAAKRLRIAELEAQLAKED